MKERHREREKERKRDNENERKRREIERAKEREERAKKPVTSEYHNRSQITEREKRLGQREKGDKERKR